MMKTSTRRVTGFTLIELMIVVVIIAILAALAMNSYRQYILRGNRTSATRALQDLTSREENYYYSNNAYAQTLSSLGATGSMAGPYYTVVVVPAATSSTYQVQATPVGTQVQDTTCGTFTLTREGVQNITGTGTIANCWQGQ
jgi:type IV pilus assembly protein PilE